MVVDGERVALDQHGRPDFGLLQHRMHITTPTAELIARVPVQYVVFDLLHRKDRSLLELPYGRRRDLVDRLDLERPGLRVPANFVDVTGEVVMAAIAQQRRVGPRPPGYRRDTPCGATPRLKTHRARRGDQTVDTPITVRPPLFPSEESVTQPPERTIRAVAIPRVDPDGHGIHLAWSGPELVALSRDGYEVRRRRVKRSERPRHCEMFDARRLNELERFGFLPDGLGAILCRPGIWPRRLLVQANPGPRPAGPADLASAGGGATMRFVGSLLSDPQELLHDAEVIDVLTDLAPLSGG